MLKPVIEKVSSIISRHIEGREVDGIYLVGCTCCLTGIEESLKRKPGFQPINRVIPCL